MNMFLQHYLEIKKKNNCVSCIPEQVYAAILVSSRNNSLFRTAKPSFTRFLEFPWHGFSKIVREKQR